MKPEKTVLQLEKKMDAFYQRIESDCERGLCVLRRSKIENPEFERGYYAALSDIKEMIKHWENKDVRNFE